MRGGERRDGREGMGEKVGGLRGGIFRRLERDE